MTVFRKGARLAAGAMLFVLPAAGQAAVTLTTGTYSENFNSLTTSTMPVQAANGVLANGWQFAETGSNADTSYRAGNGSLNTGDTFSFGATGSTDRALGALASGSLEARFGVVFSNATGSTIDSLDLAFANEQWRNGSTNVASRFAFSYLVGGTGLGGTGWTTLTALDLIDRVAVGQANGAAVDGNLVRGQRTGTLSNLNLQQGQTIALRWVDLDDSGSDDALAIDDFSLRAGSAAVSPVPEPSTWAMMMVGLAMVGAVARRRTRGIVAV